MKPVIVMTQTSEYTNDKVDIIHLPMIKIEPLSFDYSILDSHFDWLIFSSKNAVAYFYKYLQSLQVDNIAVIGEKTKAYCQQFGIQVDYCPDDYSQEGLLRHFQNINDLNIIIPSSAQARPHLHAVLSERGAHVIKIDLYQPVPFTENINKLQQLINNEQLDAVTFASSSAIRYFFSKARINHSKINYFVIGQQTFKTIEQFGINAPIADIQTLDALVDKVLESRE
ncbi:uroporphyrinogen-III synthase [Staphylococcus kloosii]|uniref:uroporphyrinogen-III synthase n=1 Tax=Staphylococcus kloosii TaxID=29384 RepID=UPI0028A32246|nr:uroporphyrinogen-III synthase [Staphylococcus kloosii]MDT3959315.1 uroporphyrinogen-III synthase [Staphylococcus kloosii]